MKGLRKLNRMKTYSSTLYYLSRSWKVLNLGSLHMQIPVKYVCWSYKLQLFEHLQLPKEQ